jgi:uncharacterized membrane protein YhaH (DUF805 family)
MDWGRLFFSAYGRIRRQEFWIAFLVLLGVTVLFGWLVPIWPVVLYCSICIRSQRLHDMGRTGWLQLIPAGAYTVATIMTLWLVGAAIIAGVAFDWGEAAAVTGIVFGAFSVVIAWFLAFLVDLAFLLWIGFAEGDTGENRFGPEPFSMRQSHIARA